MDALRLPGATLTKLREAFKDDEAGFESARAWYATHSAVERKWIVNKARNQLLGLELHLRERRATAGGDYRARLGASLAAVLGGGGASGRLHALLLEAFEELAAGER